MNSKLNHIQNRPELASEANWSVANLAELCDVSVRTLERHFISKTGKSPKRWLSEQRQNEAKAHLAHGASVKETAARLGYKHPQHFSRQFKQFYGVSPTAKDVFDAEISNCRVFV
jgi:AraC-like DNA-binding protein